MPPQPASELVSTVFVLGVVAGTLLCAALDARGRRRRAGQALFLGGVAAALVVLWRTNRPADRGLWWNTYYHMGPSVLVGVFAAFLLLVAGALLWERSVDGYGSGVSVPRWAPPVFVGVFGFVLSLSDMSAETYRVGTVVFLLAVGVVVLRAWFADESGVNAPVPSEHGPGLAGMFGGALFLVATALSWSIRISGSELHGEGLLELDRVLSADALVSTVALGVVLVASAAFTNGLRRYAGVAFLALGTAIAGLAAHVWGKIPPVGIALASTGEAIGPGVPVSVCGAALLLTAGALLSAVGTGGGTVITRDAS